MANFNVCDVCGKVVCRRESGVAQWRHKDLVGTDYEFVQMCEDCMDKVDGFVYGLEKEYADVKEIVIPRFEEEEEDDG